MTTTAETPETETDSELSEETILWTNIRNNQDKFPTSLSVVRGKDPNDPNDPGITKIFGKRTYNRGDKKEAGLTFVGPLEKIGVDNFDSWVKFIGIDKASAVLGNFITSIAIAASERAVGEDSVDDSGEPNGVYQEDVLIKGLQEFSSAGETKKELEERLAQAQKDMAEWNKASMNIPPVNINGRMVAIMHPDHPKYAAHMEELQQIINEMGYCTTNIERRKRPGSGPRGPRKPKVATA